MVKVGLFLVVFFPAYLLSRILLGVFGLSGFNLAEPSLLRLALDLLFWLLSWAVSVIVYLTIRDGLREYQKKKKNEEEFHEIS
ncbi:MAG: hypothetical protein GX335_05705 [Firmicutes bacterium]|nr:hypothetical protein [Bacillota bacterium]